MSELYDYLLTAYKVLVGLVTTKRLVFVALLAFAFYLVWISVSLYFSFQRKFSRGCVKLYNFIRKNELNPTNLKVVDMKIENISSGFYHGWKKFKSSNNMKPSDFINRRDALDVEVTGGVLNQGKSFMRTYIYLSAAVLFLFNLAYLGNDSTITSYLIAETLVLPLVYLAIMKLFYFMYTSIKQQLYKQDIECFYDLISLLDDTFGGSQTASSNEQVFVSQASVVIPSDVEAVEEAPEQTAEGEQPAEGEEAVAQEAPAEPEEDDDPLKTLDKYDVFKKKNIDVDKIINEVPHNAGTSLPYINVDSDYVIHDDENKETVKIVGEDDTATSILGGMMQDRASLKKNNENFLDVEKQVAEIDQDKLAEVTAENKEEKTEPEQPTDENVDPFSSLGQFEVAENAPAEQEQPAEPVVETPAEPEQPAPVEEPTPEPAPVVEPEVNPDEVSDEERESIAIAVSNFKAKKSKLASGGVVIERNQPIAKRERPVHYEQPAPVEEVIEEAPVQQEYYGVPDEIRQLDVNENTDSILNSIKSSAGGAYDPTYQGYADPYANQNYAGGAYGYQNGYVPNAQGFGNAYGTPQPNGFAGYQNPTYQANYQGVNQNPYNQNFDAYQEQSTETYNEPEMEEVDIFDDEEPEVEVKKPTKKVRTKEEEPRPRNLRKKSEAKQVEEVKTPAKTRGRPKKQEVSESMTIKSDKEFDEVLSRAEKLMRKSEEGLSASQSKRIEKELKMLMDAMNRYKENK